MTITHFEAAVERRFAHAPLLSLKPLLFLPPILRPAAHSAGAPSTRALPYLSATGLAAPASSFTFTRPSALNRRASARLPGATTTPALPFRPGWATSPRTITRTPGRSAVAAAHLRHWSHTARWQPAAAAQ